MDKVKILVVEDEFIVAEEIIEVLSSQNFEVVGKAANAAMALQLARETHPDVVICDIFIAGEADGIELAHELRQIGRMAIIFLTAFDDAEYLRRASEVEPAAYIVKPFEARNLIVAIRLAFIRLDQSIPKAEGTEDSTFFARDRIFIKEGSRFVKLMVDDITYVEAVGSYSDIYTRHKKITLTMNLKQFMVRLNHPKFARVHRSYLVHLDAIDSFDVNTVFVAGQEIPISASQKELFLRLIHTI